MSKYKHSGSKVAEILKAFEASEIKGKRFFDRINVNAQTVSKWKAEYGTMTGEQIELMRKLKQENRTLSMELKKEFKKRDAITEFILERFSSPTERRDLARKMFETTELGQTPVCDLFRIPWNSFNYKKKRRVKKK